MLRLALIVALLLPGCVFDLDKRQRPGSGLPDLAWEGLPRLEAGAGELRRDAFDSSRVVDEGDPLEKDSDGDSVPDFMDPDPQVANQVITKQHPVTAASMGVESPWRDEPQGLCVTAGTKASERAFLTVNATNYTVAAGFTFKATPADSAWAGVAFRLSDGNGYRCRITGKPDLVIEAFGGGPPRSTFAPAAAGSTVHLRARVVDQEARCWQEGGPTATLDSIGEGTGVGLHAYGVEVCFQYLVVVTPGP